MPKKQSKRKKQNYLYARRLWAKRLDLIKLSNYATLTKEESHQCEALRQIIHEVNNRYGFGKYDWGAYEVHLIAQELNDRPINREGSYPVFGRIDYFKALNFSSDTREMIELLISLERPDEGELTYLEEVALEEAALEEGIEEV